MQIENIYNPEELTELAKMRFQEERQINHLEGWFHIKRIQKKCDEAFFADSLIVRTAKTQVQVMKEIPLWIGDYHVFAGTQDDAFARSYALINPAFTVDSFSGYCDPVAVFGDIEPIGDITAEEIKSLRDYNNKTPYADALRKAYDIAGDSTSEAIFFIEQVTGHLIPDVRPLLKYGTEYIKNIIKEKETQEEDKKKEEYYHSMILSLEALEILAERYADIAHKKSGEKSGKARERFMIMEETLRRVPKYGAKNLYEAIQAFILIWQAMCMEQAPNPFAFSVGNADRIFEPYRVKEHTERDTAAALLKHLLVFYNVADRSWAISQNLIVGGRDAEGNDLTNDTSYALLDAYYDMNLPQPILSVKLHKNTPDKLYEEMGRFFFTPGCLTPSFFNDDALFTVLQKKGHVDLEDLEDYAVAGCQEPLIMGKDNGNTTNSWLNLGKILELSLTNGVSLLTGNTIGPDITGNGYGDRKTRLEHIREIFYKNLEVYVKQMVDSANGASEAVSLLPVPFLSTMMGGIETGIDTRDTKAQGTKYNGSGCLVHGLSVVADSFVAITRFLQDYPDETERLYRGLETNYQKDEELRKILMGYPKFGNNIEEVDKEAVEIANKVCDLLSNQKNYLGNPFRPDFATPSTHLLYGYWVGATPDGRKAREMLGYGVDPLYGDANEGLGFRVLSNQKLPFHKMNGGYASHFGINPKYFRGKSLEEKGVEFKEKIMNPLFFNECREGVSPFYLYVNVTTPDTLRKVLEEPEKYAPSGVYIMRIHGTFVNFLDLSPAIQEDIIKRLDLESTKLG